MKECDSSQKTSGRKRVRRDRATCCRENKRLKDQLEAMTRSRDKYRKRCYRADNKHICREQDLTPRKKDKQIIKRNGKVTGEIKKELLFSASMKYNLKDKYKKLRSQKEKQIFGKIVGGEILRKYRVISHCKGFLHRKLLKSNAGRLSTFL